MAGTGTLRHRVGRSLWRFCWRRPRSVWEALALLGMIAFAVIACTEGLLA